MASDMNTLKVLEILTEYELIALVMWLTGGQADPKIVQAFIDKAKAA